MSLKNISSFNKKATNEIYSMLVAGNRLPIIHETPDQYWITNGCLAIAYKKSEFIFNPQLFKQSDISETLRSLNNDKYQLATETLCRKDEHNKYLIVKLESISNVAYVNMKYIKMFDDSCNFYIKGALDPIRVDSMYGETIGIIMPLRENRGW